MSLIEQLVEDVEGTLLGNGLIRILDKIPILDLDIESIVMLRKKLLEIDAKLFDLIKIKKCQEYVTEARKIFDLEDEETPIKNLKKRQKYLFLNKNYSDIQVNLVIIDEIDEAYIYLANIYHRALEEQFGRTYCACRIGKDFWKDTYIFYRVLSTRTKN